MQCNPGELQYFLDYKTDLQSPTPPQLLLSNSNTVRAGECIIHPAVSPVGLPVIKQHQTSRKVTFPGDLAENSLLSTERVREVK